MIPNSPKPSLIVRFGIVITSFVFHGFPLSFQDSVNQHVQDLTIFNNRIFQTAF
jgi:hypothetical protein